MCTRRCQKKFASAPSLKHGTRNALGHSPYETQETLCDNANGTCKQTPGQREQRFCSSSQVIRDGFYILPPGICIINYYYHGKVGLRPPTRDWESSNCHGPPHVPGACSSCMHLAGLDITMTARSRPPPVLLWRREVGRPLPASSGGGE